MKITTVIADVQKRIDTWAVVGLTNLETWWFFWGGPDVIFVAGEKFTQFDYGRRENVERYGTAEPPEYDLAMVTVPVYIFWSQNDPISPPQVTLDFSSFNLSAFTDLFQNVFVQFRLPR